jgi:hypothetical protein
LTGVYRVPGYFEDWNDIAHDLVAGVGTNGFASGRIGRTRKGLNARGLNARLSVAFVRIECPA